MGEREIIKQISPDMLFHMFQELPVKSLMRFKCVSKTWCSMIEDPYFVDSHRIRSHTRPGGISLLGYRLFFHGPFPGHPAIFLREPEGNSEPLKLPNPPNVLARLNTNVSRHAEGLVCYGNFIWNPSTRKGIKLPVQECGLIPYFQGPGAYSINNKYMLGFDAPSKTYKVLSISDMVIKEIESSELITTAFIKQVVVQVLTLGSNSLRNLDNCLPEQAKRHSRLEASCNSNNRIFFLCSNSNLQVRTGGLTYALLSFKVGNERFRIIRLPEFAGEVSKLLFDVRGRLATIAGRNRSRIWVLEDYENERWRSCNINFSQDWIIKGLSRMNFQYDRDIIVAPVGTIHTDEILFQASRISSSRPVFLFYYNMETGSIRQIPPVTIPVGLRGCIELFKHVETVFPFKAG